MNYSKGEIVMFTVIVLVVITLIAGVIGISIQEENRKNDCRRSHGLVVETHNDGWVCVDSERRIVQ